MNLFVLRALNFSRRWKDELFPLLPFLHNLFIPFYRCCFSPSFDFFSLLHCLLVFTTWLEPPVRVRDFHRVNFLSVLLFCGIISPLLRVTVCEVGRKSVLKPPLPPLFFSLCRRVESESLRPKNAYMNTAEGILLIVKKRNRHIRKKRDERRMGWMERSTAVRRKRFATWGGATTESWANRQCYYIKLTTKHIYVARENIMLMLRRFSLQRMKQKLSVKNNKFIDFFAVWRSCCVRLSAFRRLSYMRNMLWNLYGELCVQMAFELALYYWSVRMSGLIGEKWGEKCVFDFHTQHSTSYSMPLNGWE